MKEDLGNQGFRIAALQCRESRAWSFRSDTNALRSGTPDAQPQDPVSTRFGLNAYAAFLDSPLGGAAVYPLRDGLAVQTSLPKRGDVEFVLPADLAPRKKGEVKQVDLLIVGIPRRCVLTKGWPDSQEMVERFYREFALDGGKGGCDLRLDQGKLVSRRYILDVDGTSGACMSGQMEGNLVSSLPICVSGMNDEWSAFLFDPRLKKSRPIGVLEGKAWATISLLGRADVFIGHPILADNSALFVQVTQSGEEAWTVEIHNPTDMAITTRMRANPAFDPLRTTARPSEPVSIPPGASWVRRFTSSPVVVGRGRLH